MKRRRLFWLLPAATLLLASGLVSFTITTETGLGWAWLLAAKALPGQLEVRHLGGSLVGPIEVTGLRFRDAGTEVSLARGSLDWRPGALLKGRLHITRVQVDTLSIRLSSESAAGGSPVTLPEIRLPLAIEFESLDIAGIRLEAGGTQGQLDTLRAAAGLDSDRLNLRALEVRGSALRLVARGWLSPRGDYPLELFVKGSGSLPELGEMDGSLRLSGDLKHLRLEQRLDGPVELHVDGEVGSILEAPVVDMNLRLVRVDGTRLPRPFSRLAGGARLRGGPAELRVQGDFKAETMQDGALDMKLGLRAGPERIEIESLLLSHPGTGAALDVSGELAIAKRGFRLRGAWRDALWPLQGQPAVHSRAGDFFVEGTPDDYHYSLEGGVSGPGLPEFLFEAKGRGRREGIDLQAMSVRGLDGEISGQGTLAWAPSVDWRIDFSAKGLNPGLRWPDWKGRLAARGRLAGALRGDALTAEGELESLNGELREYPLKASGRALWQGGVLEIPGFKLSSGPARVEVSGKLGETMDLAWDLDAQDLAGLWPGSGGQVQSRGRLFGPAASPRIRADIGGARIRLGDARLETLTGSMEVLGMDKVFLDLDASGLALGERRWSRGRIQGEGTGVAHRIRATLDGPEDRLDLGLEGGLDDNGVWSGRLTRGDLRLGQFGDWTLEGSPLYRVSPPAVSLDSTCWRSGEARLCAQAGRTSGGGWAGVLALEGLPLARFVGLLPAEIEADSRARGRITFAYGVDGLLSSGAVLGAGPGTIKYHLGDAVREFAHGELSLVGELDRQGLSARLDWPLDSHGHLRGSLRLPDWRPLQAGWAQGQPVEGDLDLEYAAPELIEALIPELASLQGSFKAGLSLAGTLGRPRLSGEAVLRDASAELPRLGLKLHDVALKLSSQGTDTLAYRASLRSGDGDLVLEGRTALDAAQGWPTTATLLGRDLQVVDLPQVDVTISPDLRLTLRGKRLDLEGEVQVPDARLAPRKLPEGTVPVSRDVILVETDDANTEEKPLLLSARVRLVLGDRVRVDAFGLRGRLEGNLLLLEKPGRPSLARGELHIVDGFYQAYGKALTIKQGRLIYAESPLDNPGLDVRAQREIDDVVAGVQVRGTLQEPDMRLFSEPALSQSDALSYLLLGRPLAGATDAEGRSLMGAAGALALGGGGFLARQIGARLGLEEVRIESGGGVQESALVVGHYLTPQLYVRSIAGLFDGSNVLQLRYDLNRNLQVQSETGTRSGADVFYTLEK